MSIAQLDRDARGRMRGLTKDNAERVGLHLIMAGRLLDIDPETAYLHAQAAVRRAGRIDVVREAAGLTAYRTGRFAEALRELRTVRRLNGSSEHLPLMADAERGLGRPERAIALAATPEAETLDADGRTELAIVVSGARSDLGEHDAALAVLDKIPAGEAPGDLGLRVLQARAVALESAGRDEEAEAVLAGVDPEALARATGVAEPDEDVVVYDVYDEEADAEDDGDRDGDADRDGEEPADQVDAADGRDGDAGRDHGYDRDGDEELADEADAGVEAAEDPAPAVDHGTIAQDREAPADDVRSADTGAVAAEAEPPHGEIPADVPEPSDAEVEAEVAEILAEAGIDDADSDGTAPSTDADDVADGAADGQDAGPDTGADSPAAAEPGRPDAAAPGQGGAAGGTAG
ncbi:hypothetical protein GCM10028784_28440 [Myceligenerans cantabricum]